MPVTDAPVSVALIGCGYWGSNVGRALAGLGALACVCDADAVLAARVAEAHGVESRSVDDALADPSIRAVAIATPAVTHAEVASAALAAGKHAFVEKPLALEIADAAALVSSASDRGLVLMVGHLLQYHPAFERLSSLVLEGALGGLRYVYSNRLNMGRFRREENALWSFAPHDLSMILSLAGDEPTSVNAVGASYLQPGIADVTTTHLAFSSGVRGHVFVSWLHPFKEQKLVVVGEQAMAVFDDREPWASKLRLFSHRVTWEGDTPEAVPSDPTPIEVEEGEPLRRELAHFVECVETGARPRTDGEEGLRVLRVLDAAQTSLAAAAAS